MLAPDSFCQQLLACVPRLGRYARSLVRDSHPADDLVQAVLERALSHWHQFDQRRDLLVWLLSIAHNAFLDQRRRDSRISIVDPAQADAYHDAQLSAWLDHEPDPALQAEVDRWQRDHPEDLALPRLWAADRDALSARLEPVLDEPLPRALSQTVLGVMRPRPAQA